MSRARVLAHSSGEYRDSETIFEQFFLDIADNMAMGMDGHNLEKVKGFAR